MNFSFISEPLYIYAQDDGDIERVIDGADANFDVFVRDLTLGRAFILSHLSRESCDQGKTTVPSLYPGKSIECSSKKQIGDYVSYRESFHEFHCRL